MKFAGPAIMCGRYPVPATRGQLVALFRTTIAPQLQRLGVDATRGAVRAWVQANCDCDEGLAEVLSDALAHALVVTK